MDQQLLTKKQAAMKFNTSSRTIERWVRARILPVVRFSSRCVRFRPSDCEKLAQQCRIRSRFEPEEDQ